jgi:lactaldehyde dehydrogenase/glycolaldehyde dehydrogenase
VAGKEVMRQAAENVTKVSLELGGKAPAIVMNDADIDLAVECIAWARVKNAGQVCNAPERAYVQKDVEKTFIDKLVARMQKVTYGDTKAGYEMGALINKDAVLSVQAMVDKAVAQGAKVLCGGKAADMAGSFYMPTVLAECTQSMDIMHEEIFGPVLPVAIFETVDEVMKYANDSEVGLTSTLYTNDMNVALRFSNEIECGELYVNAAQGEAFQGFHSGWKKTGIGGDDGRHGFEEFLQTRTVYLNYKK